MHGNAPQIERPAPEKDIPNVIFLIFLLIFFKKRKAEGEKHLLVCGSANL